MASKYRKEKSTINIENFSCVRLKSDQTNKAIIQSFTSKMNPNLSQYLRTKAWFEDNNNYRAYYLVKDLHKIVLYFSLQCGLLVKCHEKIVGGIAHQSAEDATKYFIGEDKINVTNVIPGVEIAHFCVNDTYKDKKAGWKIKQGLWEYTVGAYVFYEYIAPKIIKMAEISGLQYAYLFCADDGSEKLCHYYIERLNFKIMDNMACIRPDYDNDLNCLTIRIEDLIQDVGRFRDSKKVDLILKWLKDKESISSFEAKQVGIQDAKYLFKRIVEKGLAEPIAKTPLGEPTIIKIENQYKSNN